MIHNYDHRGNNGDGALLLARRSRWSITRIELTLLVAFLLCDMSNTGQPCRHVFTSERGSVGEFTSPGYPNEYSPHIHCEYVFSGTKDERIKIEFIDFDLERGTSAGCLFDYIEVFTIDNDNMMNHEIRLCGNAIPLPFVSVHQRLEMVFKSDYAGSRRGFRGRYHFIHETVNLFPNNTDGCGDNFLRGSGGEITSPGFPNPYPGNVKCFWTIRVEHDMTVVLNFIELDLGPSIHCEKTYVAIYNGFAHPTKEPPTKFCKQSAENKEYKSKSFRVVVRFESGPVNELLSKGFRMIWTAVWIPQTSPDDKEIQTGERCEGFHCKGEEYCIDTSKVLCNPLPRYCISQSLRCNGVPNCGASDLSDEEGCLTSAVLLVSAAGGGAVTAIVVIVTATVLCRRHRRRLAISEVNGTKQQQQHHRNHRQQQQQQQKQADHRNSEAKSGKHPTTSTKAANQLPTEFENGDGRAAVCVSSDPLLIEQQQQHNAHPPSARRFSGGASSSRRPSLARALAVDSGTDFEAKSTTSAPRRDPKPAEVQSGRSNGNIKLSGAVDRINMTGYVMTSGGNGASKCLPSRYYSTVSSTFQACGGGSGPGGGGGVQDSIAAYRPLNDFQYEFDDDVDDCAVDEAECTGEFRTIMSNNANGRVHRGDKGSPYFGRTDASTGQSYRRQGSVGTGGHNLATKRSRSIELRRHHHYQDHYQQRQQRQLVPDVDIEPEMTYFESYSDDRRSWHSGLANAGDIADELQSPELVVTNRNGGGSLRSAATRSGTDRRSASTRSRSAASSLRQLNGQSRHETVSGTASSTSNETPATSRRFTSGHGPYHVGGSANGQVEFPPSLGFSIGQQIVVARHHLQIHVEPPDRRYASTGRINQLINPVLTQPQQKMELDLLCPKSSPRTRECRAVGGINSGCLRSQTLKGTSSVV